MKDTRNEASFAPPAHPRQWLATVRDILGINYVATLFGVSLRTVTRWIAQRPYVSADSIRESPLEHFETLLIRLVGDGYPAIARAIVSRHADLTGCHLVRNDGYLYFVSRKDDIIKSRGEKVAPKEVEAVLVELPGITEAAVVGVPDPLLGHAICAIVVTDGSADLDARKVIAHCARRLEDFMVPKIVRFREALPRTQNGKVDYRLLREQAASGE